MKIGVRWGGPERLVIRAQAASVLSGTNNVVQRFDLPVGSVRLAAGLELEDALVEEMLNIFEECRK